MAEKYLSNDPNAGLQDQPDYLSTDPNAGLEQKPEGGVVSGILSGLGHALNPVNLIKGALDIGQPSDISKIYHYGKSLTDIVSGKGVEESLLENVPEVAQAREAAFGQQGTKSQAEYWTGAGLQAALLGVPFVHGKIRTLRETAFGEKPITPEAPPKVPETPVTDTVAEQPIIPEDRFPSLLRSDENLRRGELQQQLNKERGFELVPEPPPEIAPAPTVEQTLETAQAPEPRVSPETGFTFPNEPETRTNLPSETAIVGGEPNAIQEQSTSSVLPHPQEAVAEAGGERVGVGSGVQGEEITQARPETETVTEPVPQPEQPIIETGSGPVSRNPEAIKEAAIRWPDGTIRTGLTHDHIQDEFGFPPKLDLDPATGNYGFVDNSGKFLTSEQAYERALKLKQINKDTPHLITHEGDKALDAREFLKGQGDTGTQPVKTKEAVIPPEVPAETSKTGVSSERFTEQYGEDAPIPNTGRNAGELKAVGQSRLDNFQKTGDVKDDPYSVLTNLREGRVPVSKLADDVSLIRAEHQRLRNDAINAEGTPEYEAKSQAALDMAKAIKEVAHGPASDMMRSFQEYDPPRYDNVTDFDLALRERLNRESTSQERVQFKQMSDDVKTTRNGAEEAINGVQKKINKFPRMEFEDAYKNIHDQIAQLTKDCIL